MFNEATKPIISRTAFSITCKGLPNKVITATIKDAVKDLEKEETDAIRAKISLTLQNSKTPKYNLFENERRVLKELQSGASVVIVPAGKGRSTVILLKNVWNIKQWSISIT